ncbi:MAG: phytanoyl-CoA dioxygenase family protein [Capsulimonadaceae bacterium]|nr:phytanoyl-CoA dioxygenase family protein [Capsulimonadaceae bacterium]
MDTTIKDKALQYAGDGFYVHSVPIFTAEQIERGVRGMDAIRRGEYDTGTPPEASPWNPGDDPDKLCKIEMPQMADSAIRALVSDTRLGELAAHVTGASMVQVWWVQLLYKPSTTASLTAATSVGWHRDRTYWGAWEQGSDLFTAWLALSDVDEASGPMRFVPGSHEWPNVSGGDFFAQDLDSQRQGFAAPEGKEWRERLAILPSGGVSFHDDLTLHGSGPNRSGHPRRSLAIHMRTERSKPADHLRDGLTKHIADLDICPVIHGRL